MKINSINGYNVSSKKQNHTKPSFAARVSLSEMSDVISGETIKLSENPLKTLVEKIKPILEKFDDNLDIQISGAKKELSFWDIFRDRRPFGLKFDVTIFDEKKYIYDIMKDEHLPQMLKPEVFEGLQRRDQTLIDTGLKDARACVGKYYYPQKGETPEEYIKEVIPKLKEHIKIMPKFLFERKGLEYDKTKGKFVDRMITSEYLEKRRPWEYYRGIEFDYTPIFQEFYK